MAADAEQAGGRQGRGMLGELERGALGKGKVQAASQRRLRSSLSGGRQGGVVVVVGEDGCVRHKVALPTPATHLQHICHLPQHQPRPAIALSEEELAL
jgi:hypothetical protein